MKPYLIMNTFVNTFFKNPKWIDPQVLKIETLGEFSADYLAEVRDNLKKAVSDEPLVTVVLTTFNEEANIVRCLDSISRNKTSYPFEVVVVNNNSTDLTEESLKMLEVRHYDQPVQGSGPARQMGQEKARGKYILLGDADCLYSEDWIEKMIRKMEKPNTAVVYGRYSFLSDNRDPRWQMAIYEMLRDVSFEMKHFKRPYLNTYGISMAYVREQGLKIGYVNDTRRGNDGRLCFDLMKFGKVRRLRSYSAAAWTGTRTLYRDSNSFAEALWRRVLNQLSRIGELFYTMPDHDTKTSPTTDDSISASLKRIKSKVGLQHEHKHA